MGRSLMEKNQYSKTKLDVILTKSKDENLEFVNLDEFCIELTNTRNYCREMIGDVTTQTISMLYSHYGFHSEYYLYTNIGKLPSIIDLAIELSSIQYGTIKSPKKIMDALNRIVPAHEYLISYVTKLHNEINVMLDLINSDEPYKRNQMVNYTAELNKAIGKGLITDKSMISILKQFNDIRNLILHEEGRNLFHIFKVEHVRSIVQCFRICRVIIKRIVVDNHDKFLRYSDSELVETYRNSLTKLFK